MENPNIFWYSTTDPEEELPKEELLAVLVAKGESALTIAYFIVNEFMEGHKMFPTLPEKDTIKRIVTPVLWAECAEYLAKFLALTHFEEYTELQFLMVCACMSNYAAIKTAQFSKEQSLAEKETIFKLQAFAFPNLSERGLTYKVKQVSETFRNSIANFKSTMVGAREWINETGAQQVEPTTFDEKEKLLKEFLILWKDNFISIPNLKYLRREIGAFNYYKIEGDNKKVITFAKGMLNNYYNTFKAYLLQND